MILERYRDEIIPNKRGREIETIIVNAMLRQSWCKQSLAQIEGATFAKYRDERSRIVQPCTIRRELGILQHAFDVAVREWALPLRNNPIKSIAKPTGSSRRSRRIQKGEFSRLICAAKQCRGKQMRGLILLGIETAMRQGELLSAKWDHIDIDKREWFIPFTKNGESRTIPLTRRSVRVLRALQCTANDSAVFSLSSQAVKCAWRRILKRAEIADLHFHDLRHEAISHFFELGLSVPEVSLISGHKDARMLFRYTHMTAKHVLAKLG
ncbi:site-specific tyrosine recombinase XerC [compost metagenome]